MKLKLLSIALLVSISVHSQVGIGTTNPTASLDIDGNLRIRTVVPEPLPEMADDSLLVISRDGIVKTMSSKVVVDSALPSMAKGSFISSGLINVSLASGTQDIPFDDEEFDWNDEYNAITHTYTAKQEGVYLVAVQIKADATIGIASSFGVQIVKNGAVEVRNSFANVGVLGANITPPIRNVQTVIWLDAEDTLKFQLAGDTTLGTIALLGDNRDSYFTIHQIR